MARAVNKPDAPIVGGKGGDEIVDHREPILGKSMKTDKVAIGCTGLDHQGRYRGVKESL